MSDRTLEEIARRLEDYGDACARRGGVSLKDMPLDPGTHAERGAVMDAILAALREAREGAIEEAERARHHVRVLLDADPGALEEVSEESKRALLAKLERVLAPAPETTRAPGGEPRCECCDAVTARPSRLCASCGCGRVHHGTGGGSCARCERCDLFTPAAPVLPEERCPKCGRVQTESDVLHGMCIACGSRAHLAPSPGATRTKETP